MKTLNVHIIASSSKGNCIHIDDGVSSLLLDAGLPYSKIARAVDVNQVEAVLITHRHLDHSKSVPELARRGLDVFCNSDTALASALDPSFVVQSKGGVQRETANWYILPFDVQHDVPCLGYLIESKNTGAKLVYAVDMPSIDYDFTGVTHWLLECNFAEDLLEAGNYNEFLKNRVRRSHMSEGNLIAFLRSSDLSKTQEIWLLHMSDANSDEKRFIDNIQQAVGVPVYTDNSIASLHS